MINFWENKYKEIETLWGMEPSDSAVIAKDFFIKYNISDILIPGIGYGRNANIFLDNGINVTGIEISKTAIELAKNKLNIHFPIFHGSVTDMPFDNKKYQGIFCYALIHLLNKHERRRFLKKCYDQLYTTGYMFFTVISKKAEMFGAGKLLSKDRYKIAKGAKVFYYDSVSIENEFAEFGLIDYDEIDEPIKFMKDEPPLKCFIIKCKK